MFKAEDRSQITDNTILNNMDSSGFGIFAFTARVIKP
jgi:hypothetical protein